MKIVFLNTWGGKTESVLYDYIRSQAVDTDIFCLQETNEKARTLIHAQFPESTLAIADRQYLRWNVRLSTYVDPSITIMSQEKVFGERTDTGLGLYVELIMNDSIFHIFNFHGNSRPGNKLDDDARLNASRGIIEFMATKKGPKIIGGDFNLLPQTQSVKMFEEAGYHNQVIENNIDTTRNHLSWGLYPDKQYYADYVFTSPDVVVKKFQVPKNEVSDHLPLIIDIEI